MTLTAVDNKGKLSHWKRCCALINPSVDQGKHGKSRVYRERRRGRVQVLTSQVQVDNESPCLLCENDLREMKGARAQQKDPFSAPLILSHSQGLAYECTFYFIAFKGHLSQNTNM